jgi:hypothetical protein
MGRCIHRVCRLPGETRKQLLGRSLSSYIVVVSQSSKMKMNSSLKLNFLCFGCFYYVVCSKVQQKL